MITKSVLDVDWRNYRLGQTSGGLPTGPLIIIVHVGSVWAPFTSESKEAIAHYPELVREICLGLQECGRKVSDYIGRARRVAEAERKKAYEKQQRPAGRKKECGTL